MGLNADAFFAGYVECAFWSSTTEDGDPMDDNYGLPDLTDAAAAQMRAECDAFIKEVADDLALAAEQMTSAALGHDFWLTRNGHGAGYWDRGLGELGDRLTAATKPHGESHLWVSAFGHVELD